MIRICCSCRGVMGEKEPMDDKSVTEGICDACLEKRYPGVCKKIRSGKDIPLKHETEEGK